MKYKATIGMEVHAELRTRTKMFCGSKNEPHIQDPNVNICPVCMGHPGTLPTINQEAVRLVQRVGLALGAKLNTFSRFDRKNYFYPDLSKGYQISQYQHPLVEGGELAGVAITRVHLEEDTARLVHESGNTKHEATLVDFNRAGVPLMELVTEPVIHDAMTARKFCEELQLLLRYLGASDANMEKGEMRCEANISISPVGMDIADENSRRGRAVAEFNSDLVRDGVKEFSDVISRPLGTKVEVKNLNSFRAVEGAIEYEIKRQAELLEKGEKVKQETRGWDEYKGTTFSQREKESSHDYRYFPEPDLPPMEFDEAYFDTLRGTIPELPDQKRKRFSEEYGIASDLVETLVREKGLAAFWEAMVSELRNWMTADGKTLGFDKEKPSVEEEVAKNALKTAANYFTTDFLGLVREKEIPPSELLVEPENFAELIKMIIRNEISSRAAKDVLRHMVEHGGDPSQIVRDKGLEQVSDESALEAVAKKVISTNPDAVADYKKGKENSVQFLVGQVMRETKGSANPETAKKVLEKLL